ncbi:ATP-dependent caseinolytic (Clp) protease/crotonase family protein [Trifolium repens]|nr:ATP-dependent caseinolytic (Clp) protease/crotonase family protein [Trifolium repens]
MYHLNAASFKHDVQKEELLGDAKSQESRDFVMNVGVRKYHKKSQNLSANCTNYNDDGALVIMTSDIFSSSATFFRLQQVAFETEGFAIYDAMMQMKTEINTLTFGSAID